MLISTALFLFTSIGLGEAASQDPCDIVTLPVPVNQLLTKKFPGWRYVKLSDLHPENQELWLLSGHGKDCPGIAVGHFQSKKDLSFAVGLISTKMGQPNFKLVIVNREEGAYRHIVLVEPEHPGFSVISRVPPGKYFDNEKGKNVELVLEGVQLEDISKGAILFYWKDGRYEELVVSE